MLFGKKDKSRQRFYLLPGQGGRNYYRKQRRFIIWSVVVSVLFGGMLAAILWWLSRPFKW